MATEIFLNAAKVVDETGCFSCQAIFRRAGHGFSNAATRYRLMFLPSLLDWYPPNHKHGCDSWWNSRDTPATRQARVFALLLAHEMAHTADL